MASWRLLVLYATAALAHALIHTRGANAVNNYRCSNTTTECYDFASGFIHACCLTCRQITHVGCQSDGLLDYQLFGLKIRCLPYAIDEPVCYIRWHKLWLDNRGVLPMVDGFIAEPSGNQDATDCNWFVSTGSDGRVQKDQVDSFFLAALRVCPRRAAFIYSTTSTFRALRFAPCTQWHCPLNGANPYMLRQSNAVYP